MRRQLPCLPCGVAYGDGEEYLPSDVNGQEWRRVTACSHALMIVRSATGVVVVTSQSIIPTCFRPSSTYLQAGPATSSEWREVLLRTRWQTRNRVPAVIASHLVLSPSASLTEVREPASFHDHRVTHQCLIMHNSLYLYE